MSELKPCPFCGGEALLRERYIQGIANRKHYRRECRHCKATFADWYRSMKKADEAWNRRAQPANEPCTDCSGIVYRQTNSGKIIPADQRCGAKITPPCYQPDGDGCAYQIYGDNNDEPIERCKACPLCYSDKVRHKDPANEPPVRCGECANYQTQNCAAKHEQALMDFCSHGIRKPGGEQT